MRIMQLFLSSVGVTTELHAVSDSWYDIHYKRGWFCGVHQCDACLRIPPEQFVRELLSQLLSMESW